MRPSEDRFHWGKGKVLTMRHFKILLGILCMTMGAVSADTLLLLPIAGDTANSQDMTTVNRLYREAVENQFKGTVLPRPALMEPCGDRDCAINIARSSNADEIIYSSFSRLGSKWVFSSTLLNRDGRDAFNQRLTALSIEDMEAVTKRMADAILNRKTTDQVANLDNITEKEETKEPERRRSLHSTGASLGYLFPMGNSFSRLQSTSGTYDTTYPYSYHPGPDIRNKPYNQIARLAFMHNWQFKDNLLLNTDFVWGVPDAEIGADLDLDYLFGRGDYSPFLGGGLGLHYVLLQDENSSKKNYSGVALNVQGGMFLFRTYDVNVMLRGQYQAILNSDHDNGFGIDVGVTYRNNDAEKKQESHDGFFSSVAKGIGYTFLGLMAIGLISAMVN